jgi:hypothetical protein
MFHWTKPLRSLPRTFEKLQAIQSACYLKNLASIESRILNTMLMIIMVVMGT